MPFYTGGVKLDDWFFTDQNIVDQYVAKQVFVTGNSMSSGTGIDPYNAITSLTQAYNPIAGYGPCWTDWVGGAGYSGAGTTNDGKLFEFGQGTPTPTLSNTGVGWTTLSVFGNYVTAIKNGQLYYGRQGYGAKALLPSGGNWKSVQSGFSHSAGLKNDGTLWTWGSNGYGALGNNTNTDATLESPVQFMNGGTWSDFSVGRNHTTAIKTDGTLWSCGSTYYGTVGRNYTFEPSAANSTFPFYVVSSPIQTIAGGTNWKQVTCGRNFTVAVKTDGTLWSWGGNNNLFGYPVGQLGDNTVLDRSSPVQVVTGGTNWKQVAAHGDGYHVAAVKTDGTLWSWGDNGYGMLGDGTFTSRSSPIQMSSRRGWTKVKCGSQQIAAFF
jgi:hypothetical protein